jgi:uncharacterized repeat protein (TIGR01451 family)
MKKISLLMLLLMCTLGIQAQVVTATITTPPCNNNGIVNVTYTGFTAPVTITYDYKYLPDVVHTSSTNTDVLNTYTGNSMTIKVTDNLGVIGYYYMYYQSPFYVSVNNASGTCQSSTPLIAYAYQLTATPQLVEWYNAATQSLVYVDSNLYLNGSFFTDTAYLPVGQYYTAITNANGCKAYSDTNGTIYGQPCFSANVTQVQPACTNGSITIDSITGGTAPYTYLWSNGATGLSINNLSQGSYTLKVFDATGDSTISNYYLQQNPQLIINTTQTPAACTTGSITINNVTNAMLPISYMWSNGSIASNITGLSTGNYLVNIIDANGCIGMKDFFVIQIPTLTINTVATPATCVQNNGASTAFAAGGTAPYSYVWNNGAVGNAITTVTGGTYTVYVTDAHGCLGTGYGYVPITSPINTSYTTTLSSCTAPTGSASLSITSGTAPYTVTWGTFPIQTGNNATSLSKGSYPFHITDAVGCVKNGWIPIDDLSANMNVALNETPYLCGITNGAYTSTVTGGTMPYTYIWSTGATTTGISNLQPGYYNLQVKDANSCVKNKYDYINYATNIQIAVTKSNASCIFNSDGYATATITGGTAPFSYSWYGSASTTNTANSLAAGTYYVNVTDVNGCHQNKYIPISYNASNTSCYCKLEGYAYIDANGNCIKDGAEIGIPNMAITNSIGGTDFTDMNGFYSIKVPSGSSMLTQYPNANYPIMSCQSNGLAITATATTGCVINNNFADSVIPKVDMHTYLISLTPPRPGFSNNEKLVTVNAGTNIETLVASTHADDGQLGAPTFASNLYSGSSNHYSNTNPFVMLPTSGISEIITYYTPSNTPLGTLFDMRDTVCNASPISNWVNDATPWNNVDMSIRTVVGSYDPNHKAVSPEGKGPDGEIFGTDSMLTYTVQFQNEGTYYAQNVVVLDSLDVNLDWSTMKPIYASHPCEISINTKGVVKYNFQNIILPTKTDEPILSNGQFIFSIKHKKNLALGSTFKNSAAIYFDFNEPIITNQVKNTLVAPLSIENKNVINGLGIYPNPANNILNLDIKNKKGNATITVFDIMGKVVLQQQANASNAITLNINALHAGQYIVKVNCEGNNYVGKFSKQ